MRRPSDMQIYYQRNMLISMLIMLIMIFCIALLSTCFFTHSPISKINRKLSDSPIVQNMDYNNTSKKSVPIEAIRSMKKLNPYTNRHDGFLGFVNFEITNKIPLSIPIPQPVYTLDNSIEISDDLPISFSILEGNDTGVYISDEGDNLYAFNNEPNTLYNREIQVIRQIDPVYPWVANEAGKEGVVNALVYIDSIGNMSSFPDWIVGEGIRTIEYFVSGEKRKGEYIFIEEPQGWFFAKNLIDVLPKWRFSPRIQNGKPISSFLSIKYTFCLMINCTKYELEQVSLSK